MWQILQAVNWEQVGVVVVSVLSAYGVTRSWLLSMCQKIESTNLRVEEHKDEIRDLVIRMDAVILQMEKLTKTNKRKMKGGEVSE